MQFRLPVEKELSHLLETIEEDRRYDVATDWKRQGKKVIGFISDYVPEELIHAAGMLPYRLLGSWSADVSKAAFYRPTNTDLYCTHIVQSLLEGKLAFLDGIIVPHLDDDQRRLWDVFLHLKRTSLIHYLYIPRKESNFCIMEFRNGLLRLRDRLEQLCEVKISNEAIGGSIVIYNKWREIMTSLLELRKREVPPLSGSEFLGLSVSSFVMPKNDFTQRLEPILGQLKERKAPLSKKRPRILVSSEDLDNPAYLELVESCGCIVAMDDLNTSSKYVCQTVKPNRDPFWALAERYLTKAGGPRKFNWEKHVAQIVNWVKEYDIDGVLNFPAIYAYWRELFTPFLHERLEEAKIPIMTFLRQYHIANVGQLKTRIQAFLEIIESRAK